MRQKIENFRRQIRREQIHTFFNSKRSQLPANAPHQSQFALFANSQRHKRHSLSPTNSQASSIEELQSFSLSENTVMQKLELAERQFGRLKDENNFEGMVMSLKELYRELKKVAASNNNNPLFHRKEAILEELLNKNILNNVVGGVNKAFSLSLNGGLLQVLSKQAVNLLSLCIYVRPGRFEEQIFLNSHILHFLRCSIEQPKYDYQHLTRVTQIIVHMLIASDYGTNKLFTELNSRDSTFHIGAMFFNISKMPLRTHDTLTQNLINMMMHYFQKVEEVILRRKREEGVRVKASCLTLDEVQISLQLAINAVHSLFGICFESTESVNYLDDALDVFRIIIQNFDVRENYKNKVNFRKLLQLLSIKNCIHEIKTKILAIIDHLVYKDSNGQLSFMLVKQCEMLEILWTIRDDFPTYVMNIMCNMALDASLKSSLSRYTHNIYLKLKLDNEDQMFYTFIYNWFYSQNFEILTSSDKLMVDTMADSEQTNPNLAEMECTFWFNLAKHNDVHIPARILQLDLPIVHRIKSDILSLEEGVV